MGGARAPLILRFQHIMTTRIMRANDGAAASLLAATAHRIIVKGLRQTYLEDVAVGTHEDNQPVVRCLQHGLMWKEVRGDEEGDFWALCLAGNHRSDGWRLDSLLVDPVLGGQARCMVREAGTAATAYSGPEARYRL